MEKTPIDSVGFEVGPADMPTEIGAINLDRVVQLQFGRLGRQRLTELMGEHEGGLVLHIEVARELQSGRPFGRVHEQADGSQQVDERKLSAGENCARRDAELVMTGRALEPTASRQVICLRTRAPRALRASIGIRPAQPAERLVGFIVAGLVNRLERQRPRLRRQQKMLRHRLSPIEIRIAPIRVVEESDVGHLRDDAGGARPGSVGDNANGINGMTEPGALAP